MTLKHQHTHWKYYENVTLLLERRYGHDRQRNKMCKQVIDECNSTYFAWRNNSNACYCVWNCDDSNPSDTPGLNVYRVRTSVSIYGVSVGLWQLVACSLECWRVFFEFECVLLSVGECSLNVGECSLNVECVLLNVGECSLECWSVFSRVLESVFRMLECVLSVLSVFSRMLESVLSNVGVCSLECWRVFLNVGGTLECWRVFSWMLENIGVISRTPVCLVFERFTVPEFQSPSICGVASVLLYLWLA